MAAHLIINEGSKRRSAAASRRSRMMKREATEPWVKEHARHLHGDGGHGRGRGQALQDRREAQDEYSLISQQRTARAQTEGFFKDEIAPMKVSGHHRQEDRRGRRQGGRTRRQGRVQPGRHDAGGPDGAEPVLRQAQRQGSVTAGNSSQLSDGASATLLMSRSAPRDWASSPAHLSRLRGGRLRAGRDGHRAGLRDPEAARAPRPKVDDIELWELNEAFALQVVYCRDRLGITEQAQRERRLHLDRPSVRHDRLAHGRHDRQREAARQGALRRGHDVHRRRQGAAGLFEACQ